ncbi:MULTISPECIES: hypothetical protein [Sorangium]|uniref:Uncharacterized protein n=1 Tax=Sorangium cellulosum TaxID=56 RepID=A0A4V0NG51_SORCE|nr:MULTISPECIES: hypothetical protein [Sorangium]AUX31952.1 uncharacterized protein SOCE836_040870 [Sorangium cellulosum]WCQ91326.1 hypothetical protein NQZ70_04042 [Sorangium sp. Soce836]
MAKMMLWLAPTETEAPFQTEEEMLTLSRVPCVGELIDLEVDNKGTEATYRVVLVKHKYRDPRAENIDAEVYATRVNLHHLVHEVAAKEGWQDPLDDE